MTRREKAHQIGTVLIADDHQILRYALAQVLRRSLGASRILEAGGFAQAMELLDDPALGLAIFDLGMPGLESPRDLARVRQRRPDVRVVVLSASDARQDILAALEAGVHGYIIKNEGTDMLVERIEYVLDGQIYVPPTLADVRSPPKLKRVAADHEATIDALSERQRDVLRLIAEGRSNKEIARRLGRSEATIKVHVSAILRAIGASNRVQAAAIGKCLLDQR